MKPKLEPQPEPVANVINIAQTQAWNNCITPRLEPLRAWLGGDEWKKGIGAYWQGQVSHLLQSLIHGCKSRDEDQYLRGRISMLQDVLALPEMIERQIEAIEASKKSAKSRGNAGY